MQKDIIESFYNNARYVDVFYKDAWGHERRFYGRIDHVGHDYFIISDNHGQSRNILYSTIQSIHS